MEEQLGASIIARRLRGALGGAHPDETTTVISFDGALVPSAFTATMRTKYVPGPADAVKVVVDPPTETESAV